jgi:NAD+ kinase
VTIGSLTNTSRVGIVAKSHLKAAAPHLVEIGTWLKSRGIEPVFETVTASLLPSASSYRCADKSSLVTLVDLVVVLGGDGTLLSMADCIAGAGVRVPVLGVNFGSLGFLTEFTLPELYPSLDAALSGHAQIEERMMLRSTTHRQSTNLGDYVALNDVVITKAERARMIDLSVWVGEEFVTRLKADGLIVATPTGSTAYNLAAGGPIVRPSVDALMLTPIAPHTLTNRPIVIPGDAVVRIRPIMDPRAEVSVTFDGQAGFQLAHDDEVQVRRAEQPFQLICPTTRSYFEVLRQKLKWGERGDEK